jgi:xanthine/CO dehydrogenase XdhC/CoxF family maturation factor
MTTEDLINRLIPPDCRRLLVDTIYGQRKVYSVDEWREAIRAALAEQREKDRLIDCVAHGEQESEVFCSGCLSVVFEKLNDVDDTAVREAMARLKAAIRKETP